MRSFSLLLVFSLGCVVDTGGVNVSLDAGSTAEDAAPGDGGLVGEDGGADGGGDIDAGQDAGAGSVDGSSFDAGVDAGRPGIGAPDEIPGLRLWVDAHSLAATLDDTDEVVRWVNQAPGATSASGAGDLVESAGTPRYRADDRYPWVNFGGGARLVTEQHIGTASNEHFEFFLVSRSVDFDAYNDLGDEDYRAVVFDTTRDDGADRFTFHMPWEDERTYLRLPDGDLVIERFWGRNTRDVVAWNGWSGATEAGLQVDGERVARGVGRGRANAAAWLYLGGPYPERESDEDFMTGRVHELLIYDQRLEEDERAWVNEYLKSRWGLDRAESLPGPTPALHFDAHVSLSPALPGTSTWASATTGLPEASGRNISHELDGLGVGLPSVRTRGVAESYLSVERPTLEDDWALVMVFRTTDAAAQGGDSAQAYHTLPALIGGDTAADSHHNTFGVAMAEGNVVVGRSDQDVASDGARYGGYADGAVHLLSLRGVTDGGDNVVSIWLDGVLVGEGDIDDRVVDAPAEWFFGRNARDGDTTALAVDYGQILVYDRRVSDRVLMEIENYLRRRWRLPVLGRDPSGL